MSNFTSGAVAILSAIIVVALVAVLVSRNAQTPQLVAVGGNAFSQMLSAATAPVTGASMMGMGAGGYGGLGFAGQGMSMGLGVP